MNSLKCILSFTTSSRDGRSKRRANTRWSLVALGVGALAAAGCTLLEDNGTHLAYALEKGAEALRASQAVERVVKYDTLNGPSQSYYVEVTPSIVEPKEGAAPISERWSSYLVVSEKTSGGTSYHNRFVFVPKRLYLEKSSGPTEVVLRKNGDRIDIVELR